MKEFFALSWINKRDATDPTHSEPVSEQMDGVAFGEQYLDRLFSEGVIPTEASRFLRACTGSDSDVADRIRHTLLDEELVYPFEVLESLAFVNTPRFREWRQTLQPLPSDGDTYLASLAGIDDTGEPGSMDVRERHLHDGTCFSGLAKSLLNLHDERSMLIRNGLLSAGEYLRVARSTAGQDGDDMWKIRDLALGHGVDPTLVLETVACIDSPRAAAFRDRFRGDPAYLDSLLISEARLDTVQAWQDREEGLESGSHMSAVALSLAGLFTEQANAMRLELEKRDVPRSICVLSVYGDLYTNFRLRSE